MLGGLWGHGATDPRDYVFALLGLLEPAQRLILPDYSLSPSQVFIKTAIEIFKQEKSVEYLLHKNHQLSDPELPSWVPNPSNMANGMGFVTRLYKEFSASGDKLATIQVFSDKEIILKGILIDNVSDISLVLPSHSLSGITCQREALSLYRHLLNIELMAASLKQHQQSEQSKDDNQSLSAVWRTGAMGFMLEADSSTRRLEPNDEIVFSKARRVLEAYAQQPETTPMESLIDMIHQEQVFTYCLTFTSAAGLFRFFVTEQPGQPRRMGMGPLGMLPNDRVVIFAGGRMPFIIRPQGRSIVAGDGVEHACYDLIGVAYVDGIMDGLTENGASYRDADWVDICLG